MKLTKSLLLASAAGLAAVATASAADLPSKKAAPVEYVKVCPAFGPGFFYIPGTDTCLRVGGYAEFQAYGINKYTLKTPAAAGTHQSSPSTYTRTDGTNTHATGRIFLDARSNTEYGLLRTFVRLQWDRSHGSDDNSGSQPRRGQMFGSQSAAAYSNVQTGFFGSEAFIQLGGLTFGRTTSFAVVGNPSLLFTTQQPTNGRVNQAAYTASLGNGFSITAAVEDAAELREGTFGSFYTSTAYSIGIATASATAASATKWGIGSGGLGVGTNGASYIAGDAVASIATTDNLYPIPNSVPDAVVSADLNQAWGTAKLAGVLHYNPGLPTTTISGKTGYAIMGNVKVNLPMLAAGDYLNIHGAYAEGALGRTMGNTATDTSSLQNASFGLGNAAWGGYDAVVVNGHLKLSTSYSYGAEFKHFFTPTVAGYVGGSFGAVRYGSGKNAASTSGQDPHDADMWGVALGAIWSPVSGLEINPEVAYRKANISSDTGVTNGYKTGVKSDDQFIGRLRVARSF